MAQKFLLWILPPLIAAAVAPAAHAEVFTCPAADGTVVYQQTPCPKSAEPASEKTEAFLQGDNRSCEITSQFAFDAARLLHSGLRRADADVYLSGSTPLAIELGHVIDFVYAQRDPGATADSLAARASEACTDGRLAAIDCGDLPSGYAAPGCAATPVAIRRPPPPPMSTDPAVRTCREPIEKEIEAIDRRLIAGDTSESPAAYRDRLLTLTDALRACAALR